ncbi:hypothetical protein K438DRAFT_1977437 [Mycena galopus ATCC 62051]|nr:hypothetical protein K438DRAFT_1977437 [Mycena galopus ATCC 62051]
MSFGRKILRLTTITTPANRDLLTWRSTWIKASFCQLTEALIVAPTIGAGEACCQSQPQRTLSPAAISAPQPPHSSLPPPAPPLVPPPSQPGAMPSPVDLFAATVAVNKNLPIRMKVDSDLPIAPASSTPTAGPSTSAPADGCWSVDERTCNDSCRSRTCSHRGGCTVSLGFEGHMTTYAGFPRRSQE